jgi:hypothetical protein
VVEWYARYRESLADLWPELTAALENFDGRMRLMMDLTRATERERVVDLGALEAFDPSSLDPEQKLVPILELRRTWPRGLRWIRKGLGYYLRPRW